MKNGDEILALPLIGPGFRGPIADWILSRPPEINCVEVTAEHFFDDRHLVSLSELAGLYSLSVHGLGLSLGTPGPLDEEHLTSFCVLFGRPILTGLVNTWLLLVPMRSTWAI